MPKKAAAFTLIETIIGLVLVAMVLSLLRWGTTMVESQKQQPLEDGIAWQIILQELEAPARHFKIIDLKEHTVFFQDRVTGQTTQLLVVKNVLRLTVSGRGYQPLLYRVRELRCQMVGQQAQVQLILMNGQQYANRLNIQLVTAKE